VPQTLTAYRVFIASPGGLVTERQAFRDLIQTYNEMDAIPRGLLFIPVGWETTLPGMGRPQSLINEDLRDCDYFILVLWDRWGSSSGDEKHTSATSEEYSLARQCCQDPHHSLREIAAFFKAVDARQMSDPGEQLRNVLDFRRRLEQSKELLFGTFDDVPSFQRQIHRLLAKWVRDHEQKKSGTGKRHSVEAAAPMPEFTRPDLRPSASVTAGLAELEGSAAIIDEAQRLVGQGKLTDAETLFARALVKGGPEIAIQYARFLRRLGRFSQAQLLLEGILQGQTPGEEHWKAGAYNYLGMLHRDRGELSDAEHMFKKALEYSDHPGTRLTTIAAYNNLGQLLRDHGCLEEAANMHRRALELCDATAGDEASLASSYGNLAHIFLIRGDWDQSEQANKKALELSEKIGNSEGTAIALRNQGLLLIGRQDLDAAEQVLERSLSLATKIGRQKSMADAYVSLGRIRFERGNLKEAEELLAKGIETNERIGRLKGLARSLGLLGEVQQKKGDDVQAERSLLRAIEISRGLGDRICMANAYLALGSIFERRDDKTAAFLLWRDARQLFEKVGIPDKVRDLNSKLSRAAAP
jgi:tetratricopeptide (TPR) repeat protein